MKTLSIIVAVLFATSASADIFTSVGAGNAGYAGYAGYAGSAGSSVAISSGTNSSSYATSSITVVNGVVVQSSAHTGGSGGGVANAVTSFNGSVVSSSHFPH